MWNDTRSGAECDELMAGVPDLVARVDKLIAAEEQRHTQWLQTHAPNG